MDSTAVLIVIAIDHAPVPVVEASDRENGLEKQMQTWIALLRGINVGGKNILPMKDLRDLLTKCGFESVTTYIQSGNCVFRSDHADSDRVGNIISDAIEGNFGFRPVTLVLSAESLDAIYAENPYADAQDALKTVHVYILSRPADQANMDALDSARSGNEAFQLSPNALYLHAPDGIGRSKLAANIERHLGVPATARNLRSIHKIMDLAKPLAG